MREQREIDDCARRLICAVSNELCGWLDTHQLDRELLAHLYVGISDTLRSHDENACEDLIDKVTFAICLTTMVWAESRAVSTDPFPFLRQKITSVIQSWETRNQVS